MTNENVRKGQNIFCDVWIPEGGSGATVYKGSVQVKMKRNWEKKGLKETSEKDGYKFRALKNTMAEWLSWSFEFFLALASDSYVVFPEWILNRKFGKNWMNRSFNQFFP